MFNKIAFSFAKFPLHRPNRLILIFLFLIFLIANGRLFAQDTRQTLLFNEGWKFHKGDTLHAESPNFVDKDWPAVDLPHD